MKKFPALLILLIITFNLYAQSEKEQLAAQYYQKKEYEKAAELYKELYDKEPTQFYYKYLVDCFLKMDDYSGARDLAREQRSNADFPLRYEVELGFFYKKEGKDRKAKRKFKNAIREVDNTRQAYIDLANAFMQRQLHEYAIDLLKEGNGKINSHRAFHMELAKVYMKNGQHQNMMQQYLELLDKAPGYKQEIKDELQVVIDDGNKKTINAIKTVLLENSRKNFSNSLYSELLLWFSIQLRDFDVALTQAKALDRRFNENGDKVFYLAKIMAENKSYDLAMDAYNYVLNQGKNNNLYMSSLIRLLDVKFEKLTQTGDFSRKELEELEVEYQTALKRLGKNASTIDLIKNMAHMQGFYMDKGKAGRKLLEDAIEIPGANDKQVAECKIELADILTMKGDVWEATLLYQQVDKDFKNEPIGHEAKFKNAKLSFYMGEFDWATTQLDVLKGATSKLIANDALQLSLLIKDNIGLDSSVAALERYAQADLYAFQRKYDKSLAILDSLEREFIGHNVIDEVLYKKAGIFKKKQKYSKADSLFKIVNRQHSDDILADDALMSRARLNEFRLDNKPRAKALYQKLLKDHPGSIYTIKARKRFRVLRGDEMNEEENNPRNIEG